MEPRGDPIDLKIAMLVRNLIFAALGVLVLVPVIYIAYPRPTEEVMSLGEFVEALEALKPLGLSVTADGPDRRAVAAGSSVPMITEERFFADPKTLAQTVSGFPRDYRILSCGHNGEHGLWQVRFERPEPTASAPIEAELRQYLAGELEGHTLRVDYREVYFGDAVRHGAHIVLLGTGEVRENVFNSEPGVHMAALYLVKDLVELIIELEAWQQYVMTEPPAGTPYRMATLEITTGGASSRIWELPRYRKLDGRLDQIAQRMKQLAWIEDHVVVITDE